MADIKIVGGGSGSCKGSDQPDRDEDCCDKDCCDEDCEVHVDPKTLAGNGTKKHPLKVIGLPGSPPFEGTPNVIIYARTTGSDTTGNGQSVATAYRTFQRAIRDVPLIIPALVQYWVDITGITETLPPDYAVPPIKSSGYYGVAPGPVRGGRDFFGALNIASDVVPFTGIPLADTVISLGALVSNTADPITGLRIIVVNKVYAPGVLRNAFLLSSTPGNGKRGNPIFDNVAGPGPGQTTITVTTNTTNPLFTAPFLIAEPGATLIAQNSTEAFTGLSFRHIDSLSLQGIRFRNADPGQFAYSMNVIDIATPTMSLCDVEGIYIGPKVSYFFPGGTIFRNKQIESEGQTTLAFFGGVWTDMPTLYTYDVLELTLNGCCVRNCAAIGPRPTVVFTPAFSTIGLGTPMIVNVIGLEIEGSVADTDFGTPGFGVFNIGPGLTVSNVRINDCAADAIYANGGNAVIQTVAGSGNGGVGILADKGAQVSVLYPAGTADTFTVVGTTVTLNVTSLPPPDQGPFTQAMIGLPITISGSTSIANDGTFTVLTVSADGKQLSYTNVTPGVAEPFVGTWTAQTSSVTGTGDVKSGSLAAATYGTLFASAQYDLPPKAANLDVATGARIFRV